MLPYIKVYRDFIEVARELNDDERGRLFLAIMQYANGEEVPPLQGAEKIAFVVLRSQINRDDATHDEYIEKQRENGKRGGRPQKTDPENKNPKNPTLKKQNPKNPTLKKQNPKNLDIDIDMDIDIDTDVDIDIDGEDSAEPETVSPPIISLPLNDGSFYPISQEQCHEWAGLYPAVDVIQQLRGMVGWLNANPSRRKTKRGINAFVNRWLSKEQDKGGSRASPPGNGTGFETSNPFLELLNEERGMSG